MLSLHFCSAGNCDGLPSMNNLWFLCTFRARNKSSSCKRARRAMECNWSAWMEHVGVMQIFFGASEREIMRSAKCENVLIKHKCLPFSDYKSRKLHRHRVTCCFVHWVRDGRCCSLEHETCWKRLLHAIRVWRFRKRENEERNVSCLLVIPWSILRWNLTSFDLIFALDFRNWKLKFFLHHEISVYLFEFPNYFPFRSFHSLTFHQNNFLLFPS